MCECGATKLVNMQMLYGHDSIYVCMVLCHSCSVPCAHHPFSASMQNHVLSSFLPCQRLRCLHLQNVLRSDNVHALLVYHTYTYTVNQSCVSHYTVKLEREESLPSSGLLFDTSVCADEYSVSVSPVRTILNGVQLFVGSLAIVCVNVIAVKNWGSYLRTTWCTAYTHTVIAMANGLIRAFHHRRCSTISPLFVEFHPPCSEPRGGRGAVDTLHVQYISEAKQLMHNVHTVSCITC